MLRAAASPPKVMSLEAGVEALGTRPASSKPVGSFTLLPAWPAPRTPQDTSASRPLAAVLLHGAIPGHYLAKALTIQHLVARSFIPFKPSLLSVQGGGLWLPEGPRDKFLSRQVGTIRAPHLPLLSSLLLQAYPQSLPSCTSLLVLVAGIMAV